MDKLGSICNQCISGIKITSNASIGKRKMDLHVLPLAQMEIQDTNKKYAVKRVKCLSSSLLGVLLHFCNLRSFEEHRVDPTFLKQLN